MRVIERTSGVWTSEDMIMVFFGIKAVETLGSASWIILANVQVGWNTVMD